MRVVHKCEVFHSKLRVKMRVAQTKNLLVIVRARYTQHPAITLLPTNRFLSIKSSVSSQGICTPCTHGFCQHPLHAPAYTFHLVPRNPQTDDHPRIHQISQSLNNAISNFTQSSFTIIIIIIIINN